MAKKNMIEKEKKRQLLYNKFKNIRRELNYKIKGLSGVDEKLFYNSLLQKLPKNSSPSRLF